MKENSAVEEIAFEKALERLEKIVEALETGNISLDEALKKYEEGVRLSRACQKKLAQAEKKIEILTRSLDGSLKREPFELEAADSDSRPKKRNETKDNKTEEEDLLF